MTLFRPLTFLVLAAAFQAQASTYFIRPDGEMTCYSLETGKQEWIGSGDSLGCPPDLRMVDSFLVAPAARGKVSMQLARNIRTGAIVPAVGRLADTSLNQGALPLLNERQLTRTISLPFWPGESNSLRYLGPRGDTVVLQKLHDYPKGLQARDSLVFLSFEGGLAEQVYAYNPFKRRLVWSFGPQEHFPDILDAIHSDIALDGSSLLVATDQKIFLLDSRTGRLLWKTALPRQILLDWQAAWTSFRKFKGNYFITCYNDLFVLDAKSGRLLHRMPGGPLNPPEPLISDNQVCFTTRAGKEPKPGPSASEPDPNYGLVFGIARITFHGSSGDSVTLDRIRRKQVPAGAPVMLPFVDPDGDKGEYTLRFKDVEGVQTRRFKLPAKVKGERIFYAGMTQMIREVQVSKGEKSLGVIKFQYQNVPQVTEKK